MDLVRRKGWIYGMIFIRFSFLSLCKKKRGGVGIMQKFQRILGV